MDHTRATRDTEELYTEAFCVFGEKQQVLKALEEMAELSTELARYLGRPVGHDPEKVMQDMLEEVADVLIMVDQLAWFWRGERDGEGRDIEDLIWYKLERLDTWLRQEEERTAEREEIKERMGLDD